jgi:Zinc knuckle
MKGCHQSLSLQKNDDYGKEKALFVTQFKGKCRNRGKLGHKSAQCKSKIVQEDKEIICNYCKKSGHLKSNCFKLLTKNQAEGSQGPGKFRGHPDSDKKMKWQSAISKK